MNEPRLIPVGKVVKTHGIRGAVKVYAYGESFGAREAGDGFRLKESARVGYSELTVQSIDPQGKFWLVRFEEIKDLDEALLLVGEELFLSEERLAPTSEDEYYYYQLIGLSVETLEGRKLGNIRSIMETGANDVYVVESEGREVLIPAVAQVIVEVDLERGLMVIDPPEGLIE